MIFIVFFVQLAIFTAQAYYVPYECTLTDIDRARDELISIHKKLCGTESYISISVEERLDDQQSTIISKVEQHCSVLPFYIDTEIRRSGCGALDNSGQNITKTATELLSSLIRNASIGAYLNITECRDKALNISEAKINELFLRDRMLNDNLNKIEINCLSCQSDDFDTCVKKEMPPVNENILKYSQAVDNLRNDQFNVELCYDTAQSKFDISMDIVKLELLKLLNETVLSGKSNCTPTQGLTIDCNDCTNCNDCNKCSNCNRCNSCNECNNCNCYTRCNNDQCNACRNIPCNEPLPTKFPATNCTPKEISTPCGKNSSTSIPTTSIVNSTNPINCQKTNMTDLNNLSSEQFTNLLIDCVCKRLTTLLENYGI